MSAASGKLDIGDTWHAIRIIAQSQSNPRKAVAELVENAIDAGAQNIVITRGRERGQAYLRIDDDGEGIARDANGIPDFARVATSICNSIKRTQKAQGIEGLQGEFGIGLLSFWTLGEALTLASADGEGRTWQMRLEKDNPDFEVRRLRTLTPPRGTELVVKPLLPGIRALSGDKLSWYLASELRDRIRTSGVSLVIHDRQARKTFNVQPREFTGRPIDPIDLPPSRFGELHVELYLADPARSNKVGLYRRGTRVLEDIAELEDFDRSPWTDGALEGLIDCPWLNLTPGTRTGVIRDAAYRDFRQRAYVLGRRLSRLLAEERQAAASQANAEVQRTIHRALREALLTLPPEDYDTFEIERPKRERTGAGKLATGTTEAAGADAAEDEAAPTAESLPLELDGDAASPAGASAPKALHEYAGGLFSVRISPSSAAVQVRETRELAALARDRQRRRAAGHVAFEWRIAEGHGRLEPNDGEFVTFHAPPVPGITRVQVTATQGEVTATAEAILTITDSLVPAKGPGDAGTAADKGLPGYTLEHLPGAGWRSRFDAERHLVIVNSGHKDFVHAAKVNARKLRYLARLFVKELVLINFAGASGAELLERQVELSLYVDEQLR